MRSNKDSMNSFSSRALRVKYNLRGQPSRETWDKIQVNFRKTLRKPEKLEESQENSMKLERKV